MIQPEFGNELVKVRKAKGLTQSELAEDSGLSKRTIQRLESGMVIPRSYTIKALSVALNFDFLKELPNELIDGETTESGKINLIIQAFSFAMNLFNLKTNVMRKLSILIVLLGMIGIGLFTIPNRSYAQDEIYYTDFGIMDSIAEISKKQAVKEINNINRKATFHNQSIEVVKMYAKKSNYNFDTYVLLSKLIGSFGYSTKPAMEIANIAFLSQSDCDFLNEIAPLIFLNTGIHNQAIVKLAKKAIESKTDAEIAEIRNEIAQIKLEAKYVTLAESFERQIKK